MYVYTRQELLDFHNRPECLRPPANVDLREIARIDDTAKEKQPVQGGAGPDGGLRTTENHHIVEKDIEGEEKTLKILNQ